MKWVQAVWVVEAGIGKQTPDGVGSGHVAKITQAGTNAQDFTFSVRGLSGGLAVFKSGIF